MLGITVKLSREKLVRTMKNVGSEFKDLEERIHSGEKVKKIEIAEVEMKLSIVEILLQEQEKVD